ncbi:MAG: hypothetical protein MJE66_22600, partial [Proteobacteria bacterium]|nr:hypothetical protein [Pseudomonadota bacterium]
AVEPVLQRALAEERPERRGQLIGILVALGDRSRTAIERVLMAVAKGRLAPADLQRARICLQLAGELQDPELVPALHKVFLSGPAELAPTAALALECVATQPAVDVLLEGLSSERPELQRASAHCLANLALPDTSRALLDALNRATDSRDTAFVCELVRGLGTTRAQAAVHKLASILGQRRLLRRRQLRELQNAVVVALSQIPGDRAQRALSAAAHSKDPEIREAAFQVLAKAHAPRDS